MQTSSATSTGTQTSSPTTTGMDNGSSVTPPAQTRRSMREDMNASSTSADRSTRKSRKTKPSMSDGKGKMKTNM